MKNKTLWTKMSEKWWRN